MRRRPPATRDVGVPAARDAGCEVVRPQQALGLAVRDAGWGRETSGLDIVGTRRTRMELVADPEKDQGEAKEQGEQ